MVQLIGKRKWAYLLMALVSLVALVAVACGGDDDDDDDGGETPAASATAGGTTTPGEIPADIGKEDKADLTGAGATFPAPIYNAWFDDYNRKVAKGVKVNYQGVGSGGGINQFTQGTVDFGASDVGMSDAQLQAAPDAQLLPTVLGAVVVTYNLSGVNNLKLDGPTLANIYLGNIKKWDDSAIAALNSGVKLPSEDIQVVYRSDSSGTSGVFTDYLSKVSEEWKSKVGQGTAPKWLTGQGGQGNPGVANAVKQTPNAIGYVELTYALENKLSYADMKNKAGKFVTPTIDSTSAAAAGVTLPEDYRVSITNADGDASYPISTFTYLILYKSKGKCSQQTPLVDMLWWAYHDKDAQATVKSLNYAPLPSSLLPKIETTLKSLKCDDGSKTSLKGS